MPRAVFPLTERVHVFEIDWDGLFSGPEHEERRNQIKLALRRAKALRDGKEQLDPLLHPEIDIDHMMPEIWGRSGLGEACPAAAASMAIGPEVGAGAKGAHAVPAVQENALSLFEECLPQQKVK